MPVLDRKERDKKLRESDILKAAESVFATKGYHNASMSDIARTAQYAVGTIYLYFKDKQSLYLTLIEEKLQRLFVTVKEKVSQREDIKEKISVLIEEHLAYFEENEDFFRIYFSERGGGNWAIKDKISRSSLDKFMGYLDFIASLIKKAQEKNLIRKDFGPKRLAYILASILNAITIPWLKESTKKEGLRSKSGFILDVFLNGVGRR